MADSFARDEGSCSARSGVGGYEVGCVSKSGVEGSSWDCSTESDVEGSGPGSGLRRGLDGCLHFTM
ncbi:hypothetical protein PF008_g26809 [Phytophthora fragariae]|uniref:Uncharacterized protein n=1 Tax=Phytophthora fragariae TaxID=53985 RepID=A0A6G0QFZ4_9STRA|nr:hypothetical protein PF008_g26809 [Phytophthora fragariae]